MAYYALLPQYLEWSKNFPLAIDQCQLRDKDWVELIPRQPDVDAITDKFFHCKGKSKAKTFSPKSGAELYLCIRYDKYDSILEHLVQLDEQSRAQVSTSCFMTTVVLLTMEIQEDCNDLQVHASRIHVGNDNPQSKVTGTKGKKRQLSSENVSYESFCASLQVLTPRLQATGLGAENSPPIQEDAANLYNAAT